MAKKSETVEAILGLVMGIPIVLVFGYGLFAGRCGLVFRTLSNSPGCVELSGSAFLDLVGLVFLALAVIVVVASIAVLTGRKRQDEKT